MSIATEFLIALTRTVPKPREQKFVLAVSGGPDSTALLHIALASRIPRENLLVAHFDHRMRPESGADAAFVRSLAERAGVEAIVGSRDVPRAAARLGSGPEGAARRLRYRFLERVASSAGIRFVLTAHHLGDQAETLLLRLLRGTGVPGLSGIRESRPIRPGSEVSLCRPLLDVPGQELAAWLRRRGFSWLSDPGNVNGSNLRSVVRTRLLPRLEKETPDLSPRLVAIARSALRLRSAWRDCATRTISGGSRSVRLPSTTAMPPAILRERILGMLPSGGPPLDRAATGRLEEALWRGRGDVDLGLGWTAVVSDLGRDILLLGPGDTARVPTVSLVLPCPGHVDLPGWGAVASRPVAGELPRRAPFEEVIDARRCPPPYRVRFAAPGDRFRPLGLADHTSVFRFLMAQKVPRRSRPVTPVVLDERGVIWVVGHRIAERARLSSGTSLQAELTALPDSSNRRQ